MKQFVFLLVFISSLLFAQTPQLELVEEVFFPGVYHGGVDTTGTSDCWGWVSPQGDEYVLAGVKDGIAIIKADGMEHLLTIPGPTLNDYYYHRDIKTYRNYAYISAEMRGVNEGVQIIDLSGLPDTAVLVETLTDQVITSHNLSIDTARQKAYVTGSTFSGVYIYELFRPYDPTPIAYLPETNVHDVFARNDTLWVANSFDYSIWNVQDHSNPVLITRLTDTSFGYCHNIWPSKDGRHFVTTEETGGRTVKIWSLDTLGNTSLVSEFLAANGLVHNAHVEGDLLYLAHYSSGVVVVDISDPVNPVLVSEYDSYPLNNITDFYGCWGVYPHSPTGYIYASNFEGKVQKFRLTNTTGNELAVNQLPVLLFPNPGTSPFIGFRLDNSSKITLSLMDSQGRLVKLAKKQLGVGSHRIPLDTENLPIGLYHYFLETDEGVASGTWVNK